MRTRQRQIQYGEQPIYSAFVDTDPAVDYHAIGTTVGYTGRCPLIYSDTIGCSLITDEVTPPGKLRHMNDCWHDKWKFQLYGASPILDESLPESDLIHLYRQVGAIDSAWWRDVGDKYYYPPTKPLPIAGPLRTTVFVPAGYFITEVTSRLNDDRVFLPSRALESLMLKYWSDKPLKLAGDPLKSRYSIWYLLIDVIQLKGLFRALRFDYMRKTYRNMQAHHPGNPGVNATLKVLADNYLAYKFGFLPTQGDVVDFCRLFTRIVKAWRESDVRRTVSSIQRQPQGKLPQLEANYTRELPVTLGTYASTVSLTCATKVNSLSSMSKCSAVVPELHRALDALRYMTDRIGLLEPEVIWDVIPFSFIVDWFTPINDWFHSFKPELLKADLLINDYCESAHIAHELAIDPHCAYALWDRTIPSSGLIVGEVSAYVRRRLRPVVQTAAKGKSLQKLNARLLVAAALLCQRVPRYAEMRIR